MLRLLISGFIALCFFSPSAFAQSCSGYPWTPLSNGNPADASQVMNNFNCVLSSPSFSGNVGIGTTSPSSLLQVGSGTTRGTVNIVGNATSTNPATVSLSDASGGVHSYTLYDGLVLGLGLFDQGAGQWRMVWNDNGNVGIGTISPTSPLHVVGSMVPVARFYGTGNTAYSTSTYAGINTLWVANTSTTGGTAAGISFSVQGAGPGSVASIAGVSTGADYSTALVFQTRSASAVDAEKMRITSAGNVGIGTTSPAQALEVNGEIKVDSLASASSTSLCINANVIASCSSSLRYKEDIRDATFGLKEIEAMRPVTFKWKNRNEKDFGLIAEEVAKVDPRFVTYVKGRIEGVKYPQLTAVLIDAIKEMETKSLLDSKAISALTDEVKGLKVESARQAQKISEMRTEQEKQIRDRRSQIAGLPKNIFVQARN